MATVRAVFLLVLPWGNLADLPVHCLRHQVVGDWEFTLAPAGPERTSCGHHSPDNPEAQPSLVAFQERPTTMLRLSLQDPATATAEDGSRGTWTMIYDEAFEVSISDTVFLAFSNFEYVQDAEKGRTNISHCDATQVGWYHNVARTRFGCYLGRKKGSPKPAAAAAAPVQAKTAALQVATKHVAEDAEDAIMLQASATSSSDEGDDDDDEANAAWVPASAGFDKPMPHHYQRSVAQALNFLQLGWTAAAYDRFEGKTPRQLNRLAGVKHSRPVPQNGFQAAQQPKAADEAVAFSSFLGVRSQVRHGVRRTTGSDEFDWRRQDGKDWLTPVVAQGDCGSCYTISTVHMLTARHRIAKRNTSETSFSVIFPLYCSEYNQGCDGGYGFLMSKWSEDVGLVPDRCAPFTDANGACESLKLQGCNMGGTRYRAANHRYVGGFYGASEENSIRAELVKSGPVVMSFEPKEDFMYYKNGIYKSGPNKIHQEWEQVDHAVLLIGYGVEKEGYWTLQNSWGNDWGEDGYFRMARGIDESGCESIVVAAEVVEETDNAVLDLFIKKH